MRIGFGLVDNKVSLKEPKTWLFWLIKKVVRSNMNHAFIWVDRGNVRWHIEPLFNTGGTVTCRTYQAWKSQGYTRNQVQFFEMPYSPEVDQKAKDMLGVDYQYSVFFTSLFGLKPRKTDRIYCFEMVADVFGFPKGEELVTPQKLIEWSKKI